MNNNWFATYTRGIVTTGAFILFVFVLLQRSIEALKLKNSVEKATLNDMHMNTIKVFKLLFFFCVQLHDKFVSSLC